MTRHARLRIVVLALCALGVGLAAVNTTYGAALLGALLLTLVAVATVTWVRGGS